jgi:glycosyltransferase involved in cell wall biosynthesis
MKLVILTIDNREHYRDYAATSPYFGSAPTALLQGLAYFPKEEIHVVSCTRRPMSSPEKLAPNIHFHSLHVPKIGWLRTGYQGCIRAVRRKLRELRPDLVHGQGTEMDCSMEAVFSGFPNVLTIHGNMREMARVLNARLGNFHWFASRLEDLTLARTGGVFCNSRHTLDLVRPRTRRTWLVPNAIRDEFFVTTLPDRPPTTSTLLHVGTIDTNKQQNKMLQMAKRLHSENPGFRVIFAGAANPASQYAAQFLRLVREAEPEGYATYVGNLKLGQLIEQMDTASALLHASQSESFGLIVAEALARNLKFFGFAAGGVSDIVENVDGAELFAPEDWSGMAKAISTWLSAGCPRSRTSAVTMAERYRPELVARRHLEIYRELLGR